MIKQMTLDWFVQGEHLGQTTVTVMPNRRKDAFHPMGMNLHFFCPKKGIIWGQVINSYSVNYGANANYPVLMPCPEVGGHTIIPTVLDYWNYLYTCPRAVLEYEFLLKTQPTNKGKQEWIAKLSPKLSWSLSE